jgi:Amt family ammonium transporter
MSTPNRKGITSKRHWLQARWYFCLPLASIIVLGWMSAAIAQDGDTTKALNSIWILIAGALVFLMNAGFAIIETGFCRYNNATNVLAKNLIVFCVSGIAFWLLGFGLMFGDAYTCSGQIDNTALSIFGRIDILFEFPFPQNSSDLAFPKEGFTCLQQEWENRPFASLFFFQLVFAGTSATIVSGAVAERVKFWAFFLFSFMLVSILYPLTGHWVWGHYGWLKQALRFRDFAGSTVVHSVGGMAALVGAWLLKPRWGRFNYDPRRDIDLGKTLEPPPANLSQEAFTRPSSLSLATLGCLILWLGWLGFNGGSTTYLEYVPHIIVTTTIAGAASGTMAIICSPAIVGKPSLSSVINGILGGLVGITASSAFVDIHGAAFIGFISGFIVVIGAKILELIKIDDPVGAVPVHLLCGGWGTVAVGLFSHQNSIVYTSQPFHNNPFIQTLFQALGWLIVCGVTFILSVICWIGIGLFLHAWEQAAKSDKVILNRSSQRNWWEKITQLARKGIRVSPKEEKQGSDGFFFNP